MLTMFKTGGTIAAGAAAIAEGVIVVKSGFQYALDGTVDEQQPDPLLRVAVASAHSWRARATRRSTSARMRGSVAS